VQGVNQRSNEDPIFEAILNAGVNDVGYCSPGETVLGHPHIFLPCGHGYCSDKQEDDEDNG